VSTEPHRGQQGAPYPFVTWIVAFFCAPMLFYIFLFVIQLIEQGAGRQPLRSVPTIFLSGFLISLILGPTMACVAAVIGLAAIVRHWTDERGRTVIRWLLIAAGIGVAIMWVTSH
jgi:hypothetical protein